LARSLARGKGLRAALSPFQQFPRGSSASPHDSNPL
jgi:hypothetical protein